MKIQYTQTMLPLFALFLFLDTKHILGYIFDKKFDQKFGITNKLQSTKGCHNELPLTKETINIQLSHISSDSIANQYMAKIIEKIHKNQQNKKPLSAYYNPQPPPIKDYNISAHQIATFFTQKNILSILENPTISINTKIKVVQNNPELCRFYHNNRPQPQELFAGLENFTEEL